MDEPNDAPRALRYDDAEAAEIALERWAEEVARLKALRDPIVAGALATDLTRAQIHRIAGIAKTTIDRIDKRQLELASDDMMVLEFTELLAARAARYEEEAPDDSLEPTEPHGRAWAARGCARILRTSTGRWGGDVTEDADLLALIVNLDQAAAVDERRPLQDTDFTRGSRLERAQIRAEAAALRARGRVVFEEFDPRDRARAAAVAAERSVRFEAEALGVSPAALAAMTDQEKHQAWADLPEDEDQQ